ncbi:MAG: 2OG-Fe(II) oxygenase family protein [Myxococcota bacterium]|nr:2OG-Fe(II) oxygenase family protein [Myxococcota bacterium]
MSTVPDIDIQETDASSLKKLDAACRDHGFFFLSGHGLDELIQRTFEQAERFFNEPPTVKESLRRTEQGPLGWYDRELTKRFRDCKEVFDFMEPEGTLGEKLNRWPADLPGFRDVQLEFFRAFSNLAQQTTQLVHQALGTASDAIAHHGGSAESSTVRLNHYPTHDPVPESASKDLADLGPTALGHHTDPGILTLLLQDDTGGLQTHSLSDGWIDVPPQTGQIVVNIGDSFQVWSNDHYRAGIHRVTPITTQSRYSIPYFYNPAYTQIIQPIAGLTAEEPRYRPFTWKEFIQARVDDNFADLGSEDTQASHFRIA